MSWRIDTGTRQMGALKVSWSTEILDKEPIGDSKVWIEGQARVDPAKLQNFLTVLGVLIEEAW